VLLLPLPGRDVQSALQASWAVGLHQQQQKYMLTAAIDGAVPVSGQALQQLLLNCVHGACMAVVAGLACDA
jgi:hypothetical protein